MDHYVEHNGQKMKLNDFMNMYKGVEVKHDEMKEKEKEIVEEKAKEEEAPAEKEEDKEEDKEKKKNNLEKLLNASHIDEAPKKVELSEDKVSRGKSRYGSGK
jgi:hypothetical protein